MASAVCWSARMAGEYAFIVLNCLLPSGNVLAPPGGTATTIEIVAVPQTGAKPAGENSIRSGGRASGSQIQTYRLRTGFHDAAPTCQCDHSPGELSARPDWRALRTTRDHCAAASSSTSKPPMIGGRINPGPLRSCPLLPLRSAMLRVPSRFSVRNARSQASALKMGVTIE